MSECFPPPRFHHEESAAPTTSPIQDLPRDLGADLGADPVGAAWITVYPLLPRPNTAALATAEPLSAPDHSPKQTFCTVQHHITQLSIKVF